MNPTTGLSQGVISAQNTGAPLGNNVTENSTVICNLAGGYDTALIQVVGTYTGALTVQGTLDGVVWVTLSGANSLTRVESGVQSANIATATQGMWQLDVSGFAGVRVTALAVVTGAANVSIIAGMGSGVVGIDTPVVIAAGTNSIGTVATPAGTAISVTSAATTNASVQKSAGGNLFEISASNPTATPAYIKLYNKASAPTVGTDVPVLTITVPAASATQLGAVNLTFSRIGKRFATGIAMAITGGVAATDTAAAVAGVQVHGTYI